MYKLTSGRDNESASLSGKVVNSLIRHVYLQAKIAILSSMFCATVLFIGLYEPHKSNELLCMWAIFYLLVTLIRAGIFLLYRLEKNHESSLRFWSNLYLIGSLLGGLTWGTVGIFLLPHAEAIQQTLMILMLAGVTAGAVPLSAAIPSAAIAFLIFSIVPFIISMALLKNNTYLLFDVAVLLYLVYTIVLTIKGYKLIKNSIELQYVNASLLDDLAMTNKKLQLAATHDPLTQVANRNLFKERLIGKIEWAKINNKMLALFFVDLDHFKVANDTYGHEAGDVILVTVIARLKAFFSTDDIIARIGGDELAVIIEDVQSREELSSIARQICSLIAVPIKMNDVGMQISASIGISIYPFDGHDEEQLLRCADKCMYQVKQQGGNNFHFNQELVDRVLN